MDGQRRHRAGDRSVAVAYHHRISARIGDLHVGPCVGTGGGPGEIRPVKPPLVIQGRGAGGGDGERGVLARDDGLALRPGADDRRRGRNGHGQDGVGAGSVAGVIGNEDRVVAGIGGLDIGAGITAAGGTGDIGAVKAPLVGERRGTGRADGKGGAAALVDRLADRVSHNGRRDEGGGRNKLHGQQAVVRAERIDPVAAKVHRSRAAIAVVIVRGKVGGRDEPGRAVGRHEVVEPEAVATVGSGGINAPEQVEAGVHADGAKAVRESRVGIIAHCGRRAGSQVKGSLPQVQRSRQTGLAPEGVSGAESEPRPNGAARRIGQGYQLGGEVGSICRGEHGEVAGIQRTDDDLRAGARAAHVQRVSPAQILPRARVARIGDGGHRAGAVIGPAIQFETGGVAMQRHIAGINHAILRHSHHQQIISGRVSPRNPGRVQRPQVGPGVAIEHIGRRGAALHDNHAPGQRVVGHAALVGRAADGRGEVGA